MMKRLVAVVIALTPALAHADKIWTGGKGASWNCKKDPTVFINHGKGSYKFKGKCKAITINGGFDKVTAESVESLAVSGSDNKVTVGAVGSIAVNGANNKVSYKAALTGDAPTVDTTGDNNTIAKAP